MAKSPTPAFQNSPFLQILKLKLTKSSANLGQISSLQESLNPPNNFHYCDCPKTDPSFQKTILGGAIPKNILLFWLWLIWLWRFLVASIFQVLYVNSLNGDRSLKQWTCRWFAMTTYNSFSCDSKPTSRLQCRMLIHPSLMHGGLKLHCSILWHMFFYMHPDPCEPASACWRHTLEVP